MMHPDVSHFIEQWEEEHGRQGKDRRTLGKYGQIFLNEVWGPAFQYNFEGLKAENPLKHLKGRDRFLHFAYIKGNIRLLIEIDVDITGFKKIPPREFDGHPVRQNELIFSGWTVLRFSAHQLETCPADCQKQITQTIHRWRVPTPGSAASKDNDIWSLRREWLTQLALRKDGIIRIKDVAHEFGITPRAALYWLSRYTAERTFIAIRPQERIIGYRLNGYAGIE